MILLFCDLGRKVGSFWALAVMRQPFWFFRAGWGWRNRVSRLPPRLRARRFDHLRIIIDPLFISPVSRLGVG